MMGWERLPKVIVECGCGDGRDSIAFGSAGKQVLALDRSEIGARRAQEFANRLGLRGSVTFRACDVTDDANFLKFVSDFRAERTGEPALYYCRFFLHSLNDQALKAFLTNLTKVMNQGDYFAAEFRTNEDEALAKVHGGHFRNFIDPMKFRDELKSKWKMNVQVFQVGNGFSPYKDEDPALCRLIAAR
jgi:hypothetical protein